MTWKEPSKESRNLGGDILAVGSVREITQHFQAEHPHNGLVPFTTGASIDLAAHLPRAEVRRFFTGECNEANGLSERPATQQPRHLQQYRDGRGVVVGTGTGLYRIVVSSHHEDARLGRDAFQFTLDIRHLGIGNPIRLSMHRKARQRQFTLDESGGRVEPSATPQMARPNQPG